MDTMAELNAYRKKYNDEFNTNKIYRQDGKKWTLPAMIVDGTYSVIGKSYDYEILGFRKPIKGEYFVSGAIPAAYKALNDLSTEYIVIKLL
jgi:hypothetical protein